jgi:hypothetical protein
MSFSGGDDLDDEAVFLQFDAEARFNKPWNRSQSQIMLSVEDLQYAVTPENLSHLQFNLKENSLLVKPIGGIAKQVIAPDNLTYLGAHIVIGEMARIFLQYVQDLALLHSQSYVSETLGDLGKRFSNHASHNEHAHKNTHGDNSLAVTHEVLLIHRDTPIILK